MLQSFDTAPTNRFYSRWGILRGPGGPALHRLNVSFCRWFVLVWGGIGLHAMADPKQPPSLVGWSGGLFLPKIVVGGLNGS
jgi:hypothetical protein